MRPLAAPQPGQCFCRKPETGVGYAPFNQRAKAGPKIITWCCGDCVPYAKTVHHMKRDTFNVIERDSLLAAGNAAGGYLDRIGKIDLAALSAEEWEIFLGTLLDQFGVELRTRLEQHQPPF